MYIFKEERLNGYTYLVRETSLDSAVDKLLSQPTIKSGYNSHYFTDKHLVIHTNEGGQVFTTYYSFAEVKMKMGSIVRIT